MSFDDDCPFTSERATALLRQGYASRGIVRKGSSRFAYPWKTGGAGDSLLPGIWCTPGGETAGCVEAEDLFEDGGGVLKGSLFW